MKTKLSVVLLVLFVATLFLCFGCATGKTKEMMAEDYQKMSNDDLLRYYYRLNDEIDSQEKSSSGPAFGFGIGGFGHHGGAGVGVGSGGGGTTADELRARRVDVKMELKKRNLTP
jgi:hypothetical protein